jgi:SAM-dependent methyltransferase
MSKYENTEKGGQDSLYDQARFKAIAEVILKSLTKRQSKIFEVGCANGQLLALLKKEGYENVSGIDPSPVSAEIARLRYGVNVTPHTLSDVTIPEGTIDFIILVGVMEHLPKLKLTLRILKNMLSSGGILFISVPDAARYPEGKDAPFQEFSVEHINFFGRGSLKNLLEFNGFAQLSSQQDTVEPNYQTTTPIINGVFKKVKLPRPATYVRDNETETGLRAYVNKSSEEDREIQKIIEDVVHQGIPIIVWGTGAHTLRLLSTGQLGKTKIRAFVDSNPRYQGKRLIDIPIISPDSLKEFHGPILISSRLYQEDITNQIVNDLRLENKVIKLYKMD